MATQRQQSSAEFTARVALAALTGLTTVHARARTEGVQPTQMAQGHHRLQQARSELFSARRAQRAQAQKALHAHLSQHIGQRQGERAWVQKNAGLATGGAAGGDGARASAHEDGAAVCPGGGTTVNVLRPCAGGACRASHGEAAPGGAIDRHAL
jgi:hypothetical protein